MDLVYMPNGSAAEQTLLRNDPGVAVPYLVLLVVAMLSGCLGNLLVITTVFINKHLRNIGNVFIVNLAVADLCVSGFVDPFSIVGIINGEAWFEHRPGLCTAVASVCLTSCLCSLFSISAISFNRFIHICYNVYYKRIFTPCKTAFMVLALWVAAFSLELPNFIAILPNRHAFDQKFRSCVVDRTANYLYTLVGMVVGMATPVILTALFYIKILVYVRRNTRRLAYLNKAKTSKKLGRHEQTNSLRLARTLFIIFIVFALCWMPYTIVAITDRHDQGPSNVYLYLLLLAHSNSSINSILYPLTNAHFRDGYVRIFSRYILGGCRKRYNSCPTKNVAVQWTTDASVSNGSTQRDDVQLLPVVRFSVYDDTASSSNGRNFQSRSAYQLRNSC